MRLLARHPHLDAATATGALTISWAKEIAGWTGQIDHEELQAEADKILVEAATAGADLDDLRLIAQAAYEAWRAQEPDPDDDPRGRGFGDRDLRLETTMDGAGRIRGDLTPEGAAAVTAVLEALGKRRGPEDLRTIGQRYHDALQEGCELLIRAKMVPDRAGSDTRVDVTIPLSDLLGMDGASAVEDTWLRARAGEHGYLTGQGRRGRRLRRPHRAHRHRQPELGPHQRDGRPGHRRLQPRQRHPGDPAAGRGVAGPAVRPRPPRHPVRLRPRRAGLRAAPQPPRQAPQHQKRRSSTSATPTPSPTTSARPSSQGTKDAPGPAAATAAPPNATSTTSSTRNTAARPAAPTASCCVTITTTSASTGWAGKSSSCPTDQPAPPAPTGRSSSAATATTTPTQRLAPRPAPTDARDRKAPPGRGRQHALTQPASS